MPVRPDFRPPHPHHRARLFGRARHVGHCALAQGALSGRARGLRRRRHRPGRELAGVRAKAIASGADECYVEDLKREFVEHTSGRRCARARCSGGSICSVRRWRVRSLRAGRSRCAPDWRGRVGARLHGKGNDQVRFELTYRGVRPRSHGHRAVARMGHPEPRGRAGLRGRASSPGHGDVEKIYSRDRNLWHLSHEGGGLEDPELGADRGRASSSLPSPAERPDSRSGHHRIRQGHAGLGERHGARSGRLIATLNRIGGRHGDRASRSGRGPARRHEVARCLRDAGWHAAVHGAQRAGAAHARPPDAGGQGPDRAALRRPGLRGAVVDDRARGLRCVRGRDADGCHRHDHAPALQGQRRDRRPSSPFALYDERFVTFGADDVYQQADAAGSSGSSVSRSGCGAQGTGACARCWRRPAAAPASDESVASDAPRPRGGGGREGPRRPPSHDPGRPRVRRLAGRVRAHRLWGGRFGGESAAALEALNRSIGTDFRLWPFDMRCPRRGRSRSGMRMC